MLSPEAEKQLVASASRAITRETWRQLAIHARDIRFVTWLLASSGAGALFGDRLCNRDTVVTRAAGILAWDQPPSACSPVNRCAVLRFAPALPGDGLRALRGSVPRRRDEEQAVPAPNKNGPAR